VNYNIQLCPSGRLDNISSTPTDIIIAVDSSPSITYFNNSVISATQELVKGIAENDKSNVTRVGLVSWSDNNNSKIEIPLSNEYNALLSKTANIRLGGGAETDLQKGLDLSVKALQDSATDASSARTKKIVFITDASDDSYHGPAKYPGSDYAIYAIVVGDPKKTNSSYRVLSNLTREYKGYLTIVKTPADLKDVLKQMAAAGPRIKDVHLVETLPNYLILNNSTVANNGKIRYNGDSRDWTTTTITWDVGDLTECWSTGFQAYFCWKLPADANQPNRASYVNYTDDKGAVNSIALPEYEINIVSQGGQESQSASAKNAPGKMPGFEGWIAMGGLMTVMYLLRMRR
jgi:hypothetical protein